MKQETKFVKMLKDRLEEKMGASAMDINIEYYDDMVRMTGFVDVLAEKIFAEEIVKSFGDIKNIENQITICLDGDISDSHITAEINKKLPTGRYGEHLEHVTAKVSGGTVTLQGNVNTLADEMHALECAKATRGVKDVISKLDIISSHQYDDSAIRSKLGTTFVQLMNVESDVNHGRITLKGTVSHFKDMEAAIELAANVEGVTHVSNQLQLKQK